MAKQVKASNIEKTTTEKHECFTLVTKNDKTFIVIGNTQIVENPFASVEDAKNYIDSKPYELIVNLCCFAFDANLQMRNKK